MSRRIRNVRIFKLNTAGRDGQLFSLGANFNFPLEVDVWSYFNAEKYGFARNFHITNDYICCDLYMRSTLPEIKTAFIGAETIMLTINNIETIYISDESEHQLEELDNNYLDALNSLENNDTHRLRGNIAYTDDGVSRTVGEGELNDFNVTLIPTPTGHIYSYSVGETTTSTV